MLNKIVNFEKLDSLVFHEFDSWDEKNIGGGIYRFFNDDKKIIYVGRSKNLYTRINEHLYGKTNTAFFMDEVDLIDYIYLKDDLDRMILEAILIKHYKPIYNHEVKNEDREYKKYLSTL